jgi:hypothetical protein
MNEKDHEKYVHIVSQNLRDTKLYAKLEKYIYHQPEVEFLGYIVFGEGQRRFTPLWNGES